MYTTRPFSADLQFVLFRILVGLTLVCYFLRFPLQSIRNGIELVGNLGRYEGAGPLPLLGKALAWSFEGWNGNVTNRVCLVLSAAIVVGAWTRASAALLCVLIGALRCVNFESSCPDDYVIEVFCFWIALFPGSERSMLLVTARKRACSEHLLSSFYPKRLFLLQLLVLWMALWMWWDREPRFYAKFAIPVAVIAIMIVITASAWQAMLGLVLAVTAERFLMGEDGKNYGIALLGFGSLVLLVDAFASDNDRRDSTTITLPTALGSCYLLFLGIYFASQPLGFAIHQRAFRMLMDVGLAPTCSAGWRGAQLTDIVLIANAASLREVRKHLPSNGRERIALESIVIESRRAGDMRSLDAIMRAFASRYCRTEGAGGTGLAQMLLEQRPGHPEQAAFVDCRAVTPKLILSTRF